MRTPSVIPRLLRYAGLAALVTLGRASQVPDEHLDLFAHLNAFMSALHDDIDQRWDHSLHPSFIPMASVLPANSNSGLDMLNPGNLDFTKLTIDRLRDMGCRGVQLDIQFPVLDPEYYIFARSHGLLPPQGPGAAELLAFYKSVAREVREQGLALSIESQVVFTQEVWSPLPVSEYYRTFDADGWAGLVRYKQRKLDMLKTIAAELRPDYLTICDEPETEMWLTEIDLLYHRDVYLQMVVELVAGIRPAAPAGMKVGCGFLPGSENWRYWAEHLSGLSIDVINIHVYPIDIYPAVPADNVYQRILRSADLASAAGKKMALGEAWLYKLSRDDPFDPELIYGRDYFDFWQPLDVKFLSLMLKIMHFKKFEFMSPFWSNFFFSYLTYEEARPLTTAQRKQLNNVRTALALRSGEYSFVGRMYGRMMADGPDIDQAKRIGGPR